MWQNICVFAKDASKFLSTDQSPRSQNIHLFLKLKKLFYVLVVAHEYNLNFGDLEQVMRRVLLIKNRSFISRHITEALKSLHWLHFKFGTDFKSLLATYKAFRGFGAFIFAP